MNPIAMFVAEKLVSGVLSKIGGDAMSAILTNAGIGDTEKLMQQLKLMSDVLDNISSKIDGVPSKVAFVSKWQACDDKVNSVYNLLEKAEENKTLTQSQWQEIIHFIKEGTEKKDYYSLADSLFNAAYGVSFNVCFKWKLDFRKLPAGQNEYCYANILNKSFLNKPVSISGYIDKHINFAASIYTMIAVLSLTAEKAYTILKKEIDKNVHTGQIADLIKEAVNNAEVQKNLLNEQEKFLIKAKPFIINVLNSDHLCGFAFELFAKLKEKKSPAIAIYNAQRYKKKNKKLYPITPAMSYRIGFENDDPKGWEMSLSSEPSESKVQFISLKQKDKKLYLGISTQIGQMGGRLDYLDIQRTPYSWELLVVQKPDYGMVYLLRDSHNYSMCIDNPWALSEYIGATPKAKYAGLDSNDDDFYWYIDPKIAS